MANPKTLIIPLDSQIAQLNNAGGKGANLSKLLQADFPVPPGFIITTAAYQKFVRLKKITGEIALLTRTIDPKDSQQLDDISRQIRGLFENKQVAPATKKQIISAYGDLDTGSVAVRSSATAEDLPGISFAGQQDSFLNITNPKDLLEAVISCWSSLWTARSIGYRARYNIQIDQVSMAVVVQEMVPSFSSGVLFTANPLNGSRSEMVIDAAFGVGEALVSGQVEPDHYIIDVANKKILDRRIGSKAIAMYTQGSGGLSVLDIAAHDELVLSDEKILELTAIGLQIADLFDFPQDIEWAISSDQIYILQSRPITTLFPLPEEPANIPLKAYFSFAAIQGVMEPITPSGQDALRWLFAGGSSLLDFDFTNETQPIIKNAGERLWVDITNALRNPLGSRIMRNFIALVDPGLVNVLGDLLKDPQSDFGKGNLRLSTLHRMRRFIFPLLKQAFKYIRFPGGKADLIHAASQAEIDRVFEKYPQPINPEDLPELIREIRNGFVYAVPHIAAGAVGGLLPFFLINKLTQHLTGSNRLAMEIVRGLPNNVTTEMDLSLWDTAQRIRSDQGSLEQFSATDAEELSALYVGGDLPDTAQSAIDDLLQTYGMRGLGEIDLGRKRFREDPTYIIGIILNYLQIDDPALAPDHKFKEGAQAAETAVQELISIARTTFAGRIKANLIGYLYVRVRELAGLRESPKFHIIQLMGVIRQGMLAYGRHLVSEGIIVQAEDIFYLYYAEIEQLVNNVDREWRTIIAQRRENYQIELYRKQIPRMLLSDGRAFYEGISSLEDEPGKLVGSPVSPGLVEGVVRVVVDPINPGLLPGEIMVCQGTDPAWTPLFLTAGGLIMEVGGMMTHGAIVAREYGIPAVVGVSQATEVLQNGQGIQLNGSTGEILLLKT
jgi:pyruvate,water dikinase